MNKIRVYAALIVIASLVTACSATKKYAKSTEVKGLEVGKKAPNFTATMANGAPFELEKALKEGPVVIVFYRGAWCPVCNKHLSSLQDSLQMITDKGAKLIAVSPQKPEYLEAMKTQTGAEFSILFDEGYKISDAFHGTFLPTNTQKLMYNSIGAKLKNSQTDDSQRLPIPATYIINKNRKIIWRQFDPNYKKRSTVAEILKVLDTL